MASQPLAFRKTDPMRRRRTQRLALAALCAIPVLTGTTRRASSDTLQFNGSISSDFNVAENWTSTTDGSVHRVPTVGDTALIEAILVLLNGGTADPDAINLNNGATLDLQNAPTLNVANIVFGNTGGNTTASNLQFEGADTYTLGSGVTLSGRIGGIGTAQFIVGGAATLNTAATINANVNGNTTTLGGDGNSVTNFNNTGAITASNGNNLVIGATNFVNNVGGSVQNTGASQINLNNRTITNNGAFTIANQLLSNSATLTGSGTYTFNGASLAGDALYLNGANVTTSGSGLSLSNGSTLDIRGATDLDSSQITFDNSGGNTSASNIQFEGADTYTLGSGVTLSGRIGGIGTAQFIVGGAATLNTAATISANISGNTTTLGGGGSSVTNFNNTGSITASSGNNLVIGATNFVNQTGGTVGIDGGGTLYLNNRTITNEGTFNITGALVSNSATLTGSSAYRFNNVTMNGDTLYLNSGKIDASGFGLNLNNGSVLDIRGDSSLTGRFFYGNTGGNTSTGALLFEGADTYSLVSSTEISGRIGGIGTTQFVVGGNATLNSAATINANVNGNTTQLGASNSGVTTFNNTGNITASNGNNLNINANSFNNGSNLKVQDAGTLVLNTSGFVNTAVGGLTIADTSVLNLNNQTLTNNGTTSIANLRGGGTLQGSAAFNIANATLDGQVLYLNGANFNATTVNLNNGSVLSVRGASDLNSANLVFGNTGGNTSPSYVLFEGNGASNPTYNLGSGVTLSGNIGGVGNSAYVDGNPVTLNSAATINANVNGNTTTLGAGGNYVTTFNNTGTITASNGNNLAINAATFSNSGSVTVQNANALNLNTDGFVNNVGGTLTIADTSVLNLNNRTLTNNGTTSIANLRVGGTLQGSAAFNIANVTLDGQVLFLNSANFNATTVNLNNGSILSVRGNSNLNSASLVFGNTGGNTSPSSLLFEGNGNTNPTYTLGSSVTLSGRIGGVGNSAYVDGNPVTLNSAATINANVNGNTTTLGGGSNYVTTFNNTGSITSSNGNNLAINAATFSNSGSVTVQNANALNLNTDGFVNNVGGTLTIADTSVLNLNNRTLTNNGTTSIANLRGGGTLQGSTAFNIANVTLDGQNLFLNGANFNATTVNLNNGSILSVRGASNLNSANLVFGNTGGNTSPSSLLFEGNGNTNPTYTLGSGVTLSGRIGGVGDSAVVDGSPSTLNTAATINANVNGNTTTLGGSANYVTTFNNAGDITASNGNNLAINAASFTNSGNLIIGAGTTATANSNSFVENGDLASTRVDGTLKLNGGSNPFVVITGDVQGNGTIQGSLDMQDGVVSPGDGAPGKLTLTGDYTQEAAADLFVEIGGTGQGITYDLLSVGGNANLDGTLDIKLINGFTLQRGQVFDILTTNTGTVNGTFSSIVAEDAGQRYAVTYGTNFVRVSAVPEPSLFVSLGGGLGLFALARRKRGMKENNVE